MNQFQREMLSHILRELDYPILSDDAITNPDQTLCQMYAKVAKLRSIARERLDLLANLYQHKMVA